MNKSDEVLLLLFTQFLNGQINGEEFAISLAKEREEEKKLLETLQNNLKTQQEVIDTYILSISKKNKEIDELRDELNLAKKVYNDLLNLVPPPEEKVSWWPPKFLKRRKDDV